MKVILYNRGNEVLCFKTGERIAQLILERIAELPVKVVEDLPGATRGSGGFGSTDTYSSGVAETLLGLKLGLACRGL